jgi:hypothetical protein
MIILASPQSSNEVDYEFIRSGAKSPALFTHTLPSVRASALCQVSGFQGPVICIQNSTLGLVSSLDLAHLYLQEVFTPVWVLYFKRDFVKTYSVRWLEVFFEPDLDWQAVRAEVKDDDELWDHLGRMG